jgi:hypothetical protein
MTVVLKQPTVSVETLADGQWQDIPLVKWTEDTKSKRIDARLIIEKNGTTRVLYLVYDYNDLSLMATGILADALKRYSAIKLNDAPEVVATETE